MADFENPVAMTKMTRYVLLGIACACILLAVIWLSFCSSGSELNKVVDIINDYGYNFIADDLLIAYDNDSASISEVLEGENLDDAVTASQDAGFPSDIFRVGGITLMLAKDGDDVITLYLVDGQIELCFIQTEDGNVKSIGES